MKYAAALIFAFFVFYLSLSFIKWSLDPGEWGEKPRAVVVFLTATAVAILAIREFIENE